MTALGEERFTRSGVRMRAHRRNDGDTNWLFLPGGPGIGSESLAGLVEAADVPGTSWLVDLPGDGSNTGGPGAGADPYLGWPGVFIEACEAVSDPVVVGHSTGGMYLLSLPQLQTIVKGVALVSSAPDARWMAAFERMASAHPLPEVDAAAAAFEADPGPATLRDLAVSSAPWNFTPDGLAAGRELLSRLPYRPEAVAWSAANFDTTYRAAWWPDAVPTLVLSGGDDRIVDQTLWAEPRFHGPTVDHITVDGAGHFPWVEHPEAVHDAFAALATRIG